MYLGCASAPTAPEEPTHPTSAVAGDTTVVAVAPASKCCPKPTLWDFLGVSAALKGVAGLGRRVVNRLGSRFPGLEPGPPMTAIADPANLDSPDPSVAAAAEAKQEEDKAPQKIKAIRYLATLGCGGCYPGIEAALLAKLEDCTEEVRYEAVKALRGTAGDPCQVCKAKACCSPKVLEALDKIANDTDDQGCYKEPSPRVRRQARLAMQGCGGSAAPPEDVPTEGPTDEPDAAAGQPAEQTAAASEAEKSGAVLARVNGEEIRDTQIVAVVDRHLQQVATELPAPARSQLRQSLIRREVDRSIQQALLRQDAQRRQQLGAAGAETAGGVMPAYFVNPSVSAEEIDAYHRAHLDRFTLPADVRWESLHARFARFASRDEARQALEYVKLKALGDARLPHPPRGVERVETETYGWTDPEQVAAAPVAKALASLPVGALGHLVEDASGLYVVRVLERRPGRVIPASEAAEQIRQEIIQSRRQRTQQQRVDHLRRQSVIWTLFDEPTPAAVGATNQPPRGHETAR